MRRVLIASFLLVSGLGCAGTASETAVASDAVRGGLANVDRPEGDQTRDASRKPAEVVAFLGVRSGMTAVDWIAAGGYYTEVLSHAVGPKGKVYAQNPTSVLKFRDGANDKALTARLEGGRLANVVRWDREAADLGIPVNSVDVVLTALNFHDVYNRNPENAARMLAVLRRILKHDGVLGIIDHHGDPTQDNATLHRIEAQKTIDSVKAAGFSLEATSDLLRNPEDDRKSNVFDPSVRGRTDRFVLKFTSPD